MPPEVAEWFTKETTVAPPKRTWKSIALNPAVLAIVIALLVIGTIFGIRVIERMNDFPGADTARKLLTTAASTRSVMLDPIKTDAGALADLFFMKHRLNHYDVPPQFADLKTIGVRVFDDEGIQGVAQIWSRRKKDAIFPLSRRTGSEKRKGAGILGLAPGRTRGLGRGRRAEKWCLFHGLPPGPRQGSGALHREIDALSRSFGAKAPRNAGEGAAGLSNPNIQAPGKLQASTFKVDSRALFSCHP